MTTNQHNKIRYLNNQTKEIFARNSNVEHNREKLYLNTKSQYYAFVALAIFYSQYKIVRMNTFIRGIQQNRLL